MRAFVVQYCVYVDRPRQTEKTLRIQKLPHPERWRKKYNNTLLCSNATNNRRKRTWNVNRTNERAKVKISTRQESNFTLTARIDCVRRYFCIQELHGIHGVTSSRHTATATATATELWKKKKHSIAYNVVVETAFPHLNRADLFSRLSSFFISIFIVFSFIRDNTMLYILYTMLSTRT